MQGRKNKPVPLRYLANFAELRDYQPLEFIAEALKSSKSVDVVKVNGFDALKRKEVFRKPKELKSTAKKTRAAGNAPVRSWAKPAAASGFENYFTEGPLPPDVAAEEAETYNEDNTFEE